MAWNYDLKICRMMQEKGFPPFEAEISVTNLIEISSRICEDIQVEVRIVYSS